MAIMRSASGKIYAVKDGNEFKYLRKVESEVNSTNLSKTSPNHVESNRN